jgi:hypothetical protein
MNDNIKKVLNDMFELSINITGMNTQKLNPSKSNDQEFLSDIFCLNRGAYNLLNTTPPTHNCKCDIGFFGNSCQTSGLNYWGRGWTSMQVIFSMIYCIITIITWVYFKRSLEKVIFINNRNSVTFGEYFTEY